MMDIQNLPAQYMYPISIFIYVALGSNYRNIAEHDLD